MFSFARSCSSLSRCLAASLFASFTAVTVAQAPVSAPAPCPPGQAPCQEGAAQAHGGGAYGPAVMAGGAMVAGYGATKVGHAVTKNVTMGSVKSVSHWGPAVASVPVVGKTAAKGKVVPTTLGQVPVMGHVVKKVPVVGPVVAGPANPIVVGAVTVDNYVLPKYSPTGYTKSSVYAANNDFNTPPRLRSYVNYLAPMPYTHPPIYSPSTLKTDLPADVAYIDGIAGHTHQTGIDLPNL